MQPCKSLDVQHAKLRQAELLLPSVCRCVFEALQSISALLLRLQALATVSSSNLLDSSALHHALDNGACSVR